MKIVIEIDEDIFTRLFDNGMEDYAIVNDDLFAIAKAVGKGKVLPEHHGRLIDADMLEEKIEKHRNMLKISEYDKELVLHYTDIEMSPTIIEGSESE